MEDLLWEKILLGELKGGQIVMVDAEGTGAEGTFTLKGVPKPDAVPDAPPAEIDTRPAAGGAGGRLAHGVQPHPGRGLGAAPRAVCGPWHHLRGGRPPPGPRPRGGAPHDGTPPGQVPPPRR